MQLRQSYPNEWGDVNEFVLENSMDLENSFVKVYVKLQDTVFTHASIYESKFKSTKDDSGKDIPWDDRIIIKSRMVLFNDTTDFTVEEFDTPEEITDACYRHFTPQFTRKLRELTKDDIWKAIMTLPRHNISREKWGGVTEIELKNWFRWSVDDNRFYVSCAAENPPNQPVWIRVLDDGAWFQLRDLRLPMKLPDDVVRCCNDYLKPEDMVPYYAPKVIPPILKVDLAADCQSFEAIENFLRFYKIHYNVPTSGRDLIYVYNNDGRRLFVHPYTQTRMEDVGAHILYEPIPHFHDPEYFSTAQEFHDALIRCNVTIHSIGEAIARLVNIAETITRRVSCAPA
jgi:hypothetical protein